ncbi:MAG: DUF302 domain-containing protein [Alkalibacterium sp.]|nr:DUF302 domain-containing protein [Alkalibacterium sp.]
MTSPLILQSYVRNPNRVKEVLEEQIEVGYFLPRKVVVYEKEDAVYAGV